METIRAGPRAIVSWTSTVVVEFDYGLRSGRIADITSQCYCLHDNRLPDDVQSLLGRAANGEKGGELRPQYVRSIRSNMQPGKNRRGRRRR